MLWCNNAHTLTQVNLGYIKSPWNGLPIVVVHPSRQKNKAHVCFCAKVRHCNSHPLASCIRVHLTLKEAMYLSDWAPHHNSYPLAECIGVHPQKRYMYFSFREPHHNPPSNGKVHWGTPCKKRYLSGWAPHCNSHLLARCIGLHPPPKKSTFWQDALGYRIATHIHGKVLWGISPAKKGTLTFLPGCHTATHSHQQGALRYAPPQKTPISKMLWGTALQLTSIGKVHWGAPCKKKKHMCLSGWVPHCKSYRQNALGYTPPKSTWWHWQDALGYCTATHIHRLGALGYALQKKVHVPLWLGGTLTHSHARRVHWGTSPQKGTFTILAGSRTTAHFHWQGAMWYVPQKKYLLARCIGVPHCNSLPKVRCIGVRPAKKRKKKSTCTFLAGCHTATHRHQKGAFQYTTPLPKKGHMYYFGREPLHNSQPLAR